MKCSGKSSVLLFAVLFFDSKFVFADEVLASGIQSQGVAFVERKPELMRMSIDLLAKGDNMAEAVSKMKERRAKAEKQLAMLGATKDSWKFGEIRLDQQQRNRRKQLYILIQQRGGGNAGRAAKETDAIPTPVDLTMKLTAEWPIGNAELDDMLVIAQRLQDSIKAADLAGIEDTDDLSAEAAELAEELEGLEQTNFAINHMAAIAASTVDFDNPGGQKPGEPTFVFAAKISAADRQKAMGDAFLAAKEKADQLAQAAGMVRGNLRRISTSNSAEENDLSGEQAVAYPHIYNSMFHRPLADGDRTNEAVGLFPGMLKHRVVINAVFDLK